MICRCEVLLRTDVLRFVTIRRKTGVPMERVKISKTERLLNLISFMLRTPRPVPFTQIAGHVVGYDDEARIDSIEKRFDRDKAELRNMGIPVEYIDSGDQDTSGYIIPREKFFLRDVELDTGDAILLAMAGRWGAFALVSPVMREAFSSALRKLAIDTPSIGNLPAESASFLQVGRGHEKATENLQVICASIYGRRTIRFDYVGRRDDLPARRRVNPFGLGLSEGEWYLVGFCHTRKDTRMFKLARIAGNAALTGASDAGPEFDIPEGFKVDDHLNRRPWDYGDQDSVVVKLELPRDIALQLRHEATLNFDLVDKNDKTLDPEVLAQAKRVVLRFSVKSPQRMLDWILSLGRDVKILEPVELRASAKARISEFLSGYQEEGSR